ncbi:MAG: cupin domain-containing protein [Chloroflexi bacterium]|nr:cupin domain-containing protein [Chloroflexota bacterium]MCL5074996.1 cupin domain-containing protein [Chloroflexota bacterium]
MDLGAQLRLARMAKNLKIRQVAQMTGFSPSFISQVERNLATPSVSALKAISEALGVPIASFFEKVKPPPREGKIESSDEVVVRKHSRKSLVYPGSNIHYELLSPNLQGRMEFLYIRAAAGVGSESYYRHEGEECGFVQRGTMQIEINDNTYTLEAGDSIYFKSTSPHRWRNIGTEDLELIWVITPPTF